MQTNRKRETAKILIACGGKTGTCMKAAQLLATRLTRSDVTLKDMRYEGVPSRAELRVYDAVIVGGSVRMGSLDNLALEAFCTAQEAKDDGACPDVLLGGFICCGHPERMREYVAKIPRAIMNGELSVNCFGGELSLERTRGLEKIFVRMMRNKILYGGENGDGEVGVALPTLNESDIGQFAVKLADVINAGA